MVNNYVFRYCAKHSLLLSFLFFVFFFLHEVLPQFIPNIVFTSSATKTINNNNNWSRHTVNNLLKKRLPFVGIDYEPAQARDLLP